MEASLAGLRPDDESPGAMWIRGVLSHRDWLAAVSGSRPAPATMAFSVMSMNPNRINFTPDAEENLAIEALIQRKPSANQSNKCAALLR
jgi:hypothetical protein